MPTPRRWRRGLLALLILFVLLAGVGCWLATPTGLVAQFHELRTGMTRAEVEALLGGPPHSGIAGTTTVSWHLPEGHLNVEFSKGNPQFLQRRQYQLREHWTHRPWPRRFFNWLGWWPTSEGKWL